MQFQQTNRSVISSIELMCAAGGSVLENMRIADRSYPQRSKSGAIILRANCWHSVRHSDSFQVQWNMQWKWEQAACWKSKVFLEWCGVNHFWILLTVTSVFESSCFHAPGSGSCRFSLGLHYKTKLTNILGHTKLQRVLLIIFPILVTMILLLDECASSNFNEFVGCTPEKCQLHALLVGMKCGYEYNRWTDAFAGSSRWYSPSHMIVQDQDTLYYFHDTPTNHGLCSKMH